MALSKKTLKLLFDRDSHCWHCGREDDLVPHHRINRGMGGSKKLDGLQNLILVCAVWNGEMESVSRAAQTARGWKHKLSVWDSVDLPVFDAYSFSWYVLMPDGSKVKESIDLDF